METFVAAGAGFLLAVLWFDLMFDVQVLGSGEIDDVVLASIAAYYQRVTTNARPMNRLVALAMLATLVAVGLEVALQDAPTWASLVSLPLVICPVLLAGVRTVPSAVRLGARADPSERQVELSRRILRDHLFCFASIATLVAVQLSASVIGGS